MMLPYFTLFSSALLTSLVIPAFGQFSENADASGISHMCRSVNNMGGGVAVFDFNNDGWDDIYLTGGQDPDHLYQNNGDGTFTLLPASEGLFLGSLYYTSGVTTGDIDNDGFRDILILTYRDEPNVLLRNNGDGTFTYLPTALSPHTDWSVSASFGDVNNDGWLDIYIINYVQEDHLIIESGQVIGYAHDCFENLLYLNNGDLTFTEAAPLFQAGNPGCGLAGAFTDFDSDGDADIFVVNDFGEWLAPNTILENMYPFPSFTDAGLNLGANQGMNGMGIAIGDFDRDSDLDYYITDVGMNLLLRNDGQYFSDVTEGSGVENDSIGGFNTVGWGTVELDFDNDGWPDLYVGNGNIALPPFIQGSEDNSDRLFRNLGGNQFGDVTESQGLGGPTRSRGVARGDFNNDGRTDIVVCHTAPEEGMASSRLYLNAHETTDHWLKVSLQGTLASRDAFGSQVIVVTGGYRTIQEVDGGSSYASQNSSVLNFGLGPMAYADSVIVNFLSGTRQVLTNVPGNHQIHVVENAPVTGLGQIQFAQDGRGNVTLNSLAHHAQVCWNLYDSAGRTVTSGTGAADTGNLHIPTNGHGQVASGIYLLQIHCGDQRDTFKVLISQ